MSARTLLDFDACVSLDTTTKDAVPEMTRVSQCPNRKLPLRVEICFFVNIVTHASFEIYFNCPQELAVKGSRQGKHQREQHGLKHRAARGFDHAWRCADLAG